MQGRTDLEEPRPKKACLPGTPDFLQTLASVKGVHRTPQPFIHSAIRSIVTVYFPTIWQPLPPVPTKDKNPQMRQASRPGRQHGGRARGDELSVVVVVVRCT